MTTIENPTTWRDYADQLTARQIDLLSSGRALSMTEAELIEIAKGDVEYNTMQARYAHIPAPTGAHELFTWFPWDEGVALRSFHGRAWQISEDVTVRIAGQQSSDGATTQYVELYAREGSDAELTAEQARQAAEALGAAADELDRLTGVDPPFM